MERNLIRVSELVGILKWTTGDARDLKGIVSVIQVVSQVCHLWNFDLEAEVEGEAPITSSVQLNFYRVGGCHWVPPSGWAVKVH